MESYSSFRKIYKESIELDGLVAIKQFVVSDSFDENKIIESTKLNDNNEEENEKSEENNDYFLNTNVFDSPLKVELKSPVPILESFDLLKSPE